MDIQFFHVIVAVMATGTLFANMHALEIFVLAGHWTGPLQHQRKCSQRLKSVQCYKEQNHRSCFCFSIH